MRLVFFFKNCPAFEIPGPEIFAFNPVHFAGFGGRYIFMPLLDRTVYKELTGNAERERNESE